MRNIKLTKTSQQVIGQTVKFIISATDGVSVDNNIFRMAERPLNPADENGEKKSDFTGVCSAYDLNVLPVSTPNTGNPLYRIDTIELTFSNPNDGNDTWELLKKDVKQLIDDLNAMDKLSSVEVVNIN